MSKSVTDRTGELLSALRRARLAYINGEVDSLVWIHERRLIMTEAEVLGLTDEMLARAGEVTDGPCAERYCGPDCGFLLGYGGCSITGGGD